MEQTHLQLRDFLEGYAFRIQCQSCRFEWRQTPNEVAAREDSHLNMYLDEISALIPCRRCHKQNNHITVEVLCDKHCWVAGMP